MRPPLYLAPLAAIIPYLASAQDACASNPDPVVLPISSIPIHPFQGQLRRGLKVNIGTPPQQLAFQVDTNLNNTLLYDASPLKCEPDVGPAQCAAERGGLYYQNASSTWTNRTSYKAAGASPDPLWNDTNSDGGDYFGTDTFKIAGYTFDNFPVGIQTESYHIDKWAIQHLGLNSNSTILNALKSAKAIATRSFGYWYGYVGKSYTDGELVLGGLNRARTQYANLTLALQPSRNCPSGMVVNVNAITMTYNQGDPLQPYTRGKTQDTNILGSSASASINYCIWPSYDVISMPSHLWENFLSVAGGTQTGYSGTRSLGLNVYGEDFLANSVYQGDLSFTIQNSLTITIPNQQLVIPDIDLDSQGNVVEKNSSVAEVMINSLESTNGDDMAILGRTFLTSAYLYVDYETNTFTLWQYQNTTKNQYEVHTQNNSCSASAQDPNSNTTSLSGNNPQQTSNTSSKLSAGAIAGIVVGAITGLALVAAAIIAFLAWKRKRHAYERANMYPEKPESALGHYRQPIGQAVHASPPTQEMPADEEATRSHPELPGTPGGTKFQHDPMPNGAAEVAAGGLSHFERDKMRREGMESMNFGAPVEMEGSAYSQSLMKPGTGEPR